MDKNFYDMQIENINLSETLWNDTFTKIKNISLNETQLLYFTQIILHKGDSNILGQYIDYLINMQIPIYQQCLRGIFFYLISLPTVDQSHVNLINKIIDVIKDYKYFAANFNPNVHIKYAKMLHNIYVNYPNIQYTIEQIINILPDDFKSVFIKEVYNYE